MLPTILLRIPTLIPFLLAGVFNGPFLLSSSSGDNVATYFNKANSYLMQGEFDSALESFNKAAEMSPNTGDIYLSRGIALEKLLRWDDAIADYKHANEIFKQRPFSRDDPTVFSNIGNAETGLLKWNEALKDFSYAASLKPDFLAPQIGRALVLFQIGREDEARVFFEALIGKYPQFPDGLAAFTVMQYKALTSAPSSLVSSEAVGKVENNWEDALQEDSRYLDIEWVRDIRRWPPRLVDSLVDYLEARKAVK